MHEGAWLPHEFFIVFWTLLWLVFQSPKNSRASPTIASVAVAVTMMG